MTQDLFPDRGPDGEEPDGSGPLPAGDGPSGADGTGGPGSGPQGGPGGSGRDGGPLRRARLGGAPKVAALVNFTVPLATALGHPEPDVLIWRTPAGCTYATTPTSCRAEPGRCHPPDRVPG
jgi:hypothetical protein